MTGIVEDDGTAPLPARTFLRVPRGTTLTILLALVTRLGVPVDASTVTAATLVVARTLCGPPLLSVPGTASPTDGPNVFQFLLTSANTSTGIDPAGRGGQFLFDAQISRSGAIDYPVPLSTLAIEATA